MVSISLSSNPMTVDRSVIKIMIASDNDSRVVALQWTLRYKVDEVNHIDVGPGPEAISAGKQINCANAKGQLTCILWGLNRNVLRNGNIAKVTVVLHDKSGTTPVLALVGGSASSAAGYSLPLEGLSRYVRVQPAPFRRSELNWGIPFEIAAMLALVGLRKRMRRVRTD